MNATNGSRIVKCIAWGKFDSIDNGEGYKVKHISVKSGAKLGVQMHHYRAEHWVVVSELQK